MSTRVIDPAAVQRFTAALVDLLQALGPAVPVVPPPADDLLSPAEAAKLLHVSTKYLYGHARELGVVRLGKGPRGRLRFRRSRLLKSA